MLDDEVLFAAHFALPLHVLGHAGCHKNVLSISTPAVISQRSSLHIPLPVHTFTDLNSRHSLMITVHIRQSDRCRMAQSRPEVVRAALRWQSGLSAVIRGEQMWEES